MIEATALLVGYLVGSLPTANALARLRGIDLRGGGSGNPGTNNARKLGGYGLAVSVLVVEVAKGVLAPAIGLWIGDETSAVIAGIAAIGGNVYNVWYRFQGGKGLAIGGGVLLILWPPALGLAVFLIAATTATTRSSGKASVVALMALVLAGFGWWVFGYKNAWGVGDVSLLPYLAVAMAVLIMPKHVRDIRNDVTAPSHPEP